MKYHFVECPVCKFERREEVGKPELCPICNRDIEKENKK